MLEYMNHAGVLIKDDKHYSWRCTECGERGKSTRILKQCPKCPQIYNCRDCGAEFKGDGIQETCPTCAYEELLQGTGPD